MKTDFRPTGVPLIRIAGMANHEVTLDGCNYLDPEKVQKKWNHFRLDAGDVLVSSSASLDKVCVVGKEAVGAIPYTGIIRFKSKGFLDLRYFQYFAKTECFKEQISANKTGTTIKHFGPTHLKKMLIPIPPMEEQYRLVEKLEKIFNQIDKAEKAYKELLGPLYDHLCQLCLEKAIRGKLVPQLENEPYVVQVGEKPYNAPFTIPDKWKWVQLRAVGKIVGGGTPRTNIPEYWNHGVIPWFTPADLGKVTNIYVETSSRKITTKGLANSSATMMPKNTILFSSRAPIGYIALATENCCTNQGCKSFVANESVILPMWAYWVLKARTPDIVSRASGTTFKEISSRGMGDTWIPLPPMAEQKRIIAKIQELFDIGKKILFDRYNVVKISKE